jgi:pimeloyl-ACP methyl ester carboxylesterase
VHGRPQTWYAWRLVMPGLAQNFQVVAPHQRGCGLSSKPPGGYDTATLASDLAALMDALGHNGSPWPATTPGCGLATP